MDSMTPDPTTFADYIADIIATGGKPPLTYDAWLAQRGRTKCGACNGTGLAPEAETAMLSAVESGQWNVRNYGTNVWMIFDEAGKLLGSRPNLRAAITAAMNNTQNLKEQILSLISDLFGDMDADEAQQADALEEIESLARDNAESLREQIRSRAE